MLSIPLSAFLLLLESARKADLKRPYLNQLGWLTDSFSFSDLRARYMPRIFFFIFLLFASPAIAGGTLNVDVESWKEDGGVFWYNLRNGSHVPLEVFSLSKLNYADPNLTWTPPGWDLVQMNGETFVWIASPGHALRPGGELCCFIVWGGRDGYGWVNWMLSGTDNGGGASWGNAYGHPRN